MPMKSLFPTQLTTSIAARLLRVIFASYFVVTVIVTCVQITLEYQNAESSLLRDVKLMEQTFGPGINDAVWNLNYSSLDGILAGMLQQPIVIGVKVVNATDRLVSSAGLIKDEGGQRFMVDAQRRLIPILEREAAFDKVLSQTFPIIYTDADGAKTIGSWTVYSSQKFVVNQVKFGVMLLLFNSIIKTLALWFIFLFVVHRLLGRPLQQLSAFVGRLNIENLGKEVFVLQDRSRHELHLLADKLNELQHTLRSSVTENASLFAQLQAEQATTLELNANLERRVDQRTAALAESNRALSLAYQAAEEARADLVEAEKLASLGSLVAGVSHELNTPIGIALTMATTLEHETEVFQKAVALGAIRRSDLDQFLSRNVEFSTLLTRSCERAVQLITSFKQVAVDQTSEQQREFNLYELVVDIMMTLQPSLRHEKWTIQPDIPKDIVCNSYPGPLGQVLVNIVQNAKHAFEGRDHGVLRISAQLAGDGVEMVISDDGHGMPPETLAHIFDPFFTTRLGQGGSGLGLAISRNLVVGVLGGALHATSEVGVGTRMVLTFPLYAPQRLVPMVVASQS